jgi:hypothetical protein
MAARFRASVITERHNDRLRGGNAFSVAAHAGPAGGTYDYPPGGVFGQARRHAAPGAGRQGGEGRGCEHPSIAAPQALPPVFAFVTTLLMMGWPVIVIGLAIADPPPAGVFAYLTDPRELAMVMTD